MLAKLYSESFKLGFSSTQTQSFQMYKLSREKAEEPQIKLQHSLDHRKKEKKTRKAYFCFIVYAKAFDCMDQKKKKKNWKIHKEMGIPDHFTYLLRNLYAYHEATLRTLNGTTDWFKIVKRVMYIVILFNFYAEYIMRNAGLDESQVRIKLVRSNINNLRYADDTTLMTESKEELNSL